MKCLNDTIIRAFLDKELTEKKRHQVEAHIRECQACQARLQLTQGEILHIQSYLERLEPETVPGPPVLLLVNKNRKPFIRRWLLASVRIPAGVLVILVVLSLAFSMMLFAKIKKEPEASAGVIYFISEKSMKSICVNHDIKDLQPIKNPRVFKFKESEK